MRYIFDHYYAMDHKNYCRVVESDKDVTDVKRLLVAIQFFYEENMDECSNPTFDSVIEILCRHYGFERVEKSEIKELSIMLEDFLEDCSEDKYKGYTYIDMYWTREHLCGPGQPEQLFYEWLTEEIKEDLKKTLVEEG